jgi:hypothetical protein
VPLRQRPIADQPYRRHQDPEISGGRHPYLAEAPAVEGRRLCGVAKNCPDV